MTTVGVHCLPRTEATLRLLRAAGIPLLVIDSCAIMESMECEDFLISALRDTRPPFGVLPPTIRHVPSAYGRNYAPPCRMPQQPCLDGAKLEYG